MFTKAELIDAINELEEGKHSIQNCEKLAAIYTVLDHLYPKEQPQEYNLDRGYSRAAANVENVEQVIDDYGDTEFLNVISGRNARDMWLLMDELMTTLMVVNPRLYDSVIRKIQ